MLYKKEKLHEMSHISNYIATQNQTTVGKKKLINWKGDQWSHVIMEVIWSHEINIFLFEIMSENM